MFAAIRAVNGTLAAHVQIYLWMTERTAAAFTSNFFLVHFNSFRALHLFYPNLDKISLQAIYQQSEMKTSFSDGQN